MEVIYLAGLGALCFCIYLFNQNRNLRKQSEELGELLSRTIVDSEKQLEDQQSTERELAIIKAKLEAIQSSGLTPDNSIPKELHTEKVLELANKLSATEMMLKDTQKKFEESRGKQISERVRLGQVGENFAAFHDQFPYSRKDTKALFQPVDLICFEEDEIIFIDVKTGSSQLSKKQRNIRDNIKNGNVRFEIHRLDENGYSIKKEA